MKRRGLFAMTGAAIARKALHFVEQPLKYVVRPGHIDVLHEVTPGIYRYVRVIWTED